MNDLTAFVNKIFSLKSALIFCHARPDGDTIGCAAALCMALESKGVKADIVCCDPIPEKFAFFDYYKRILTTNQVTNKYEGHIAVDISVCNLFGDSFNLFKSNFNNFCIDHHISNGKYAKYYYIDNCASTTIMIYELLKIANVDITSQIAEQILLGIVTDTGNFVNKNCDSKAFLTAGKMIEYGADHNKIVYNAIKKQSKQRAKMYIDVMSKVKYYHNDQLAIITITKQTLNDYALTEADTEGFADYPLTVDGVEVAISILQSKKNAFRISLRSKGKVDVNEIACRFGGGGHTLASGCLLCGFYEDVIDKLVYNVGTVL